MLLKGLTIEAYQTFYKDNIANRKKTRAGAKVELIGEEKVMEDITSAQKGLSDIKEGDNLNNAQQVVKPQNTDAGSEVAVPEAKTTPETPAENKQAQSPAKTSEAAPQPAKELKKYKGLYTYDKEAPHYFVILIPKGDADFNTVKTAIDKYNSTSQALLNLTVTQDSGKNLAQMIIAGVIPGADVAQSYLLQVVKDEGIKESLKNINYRNIVISQDNLKTLKESGNFTVYMELFKHFYLK